MASLAQHTANHANAQLSTGPRTPAGKQRSKLNGFRHGLTGQIYIFTPEDQAAFDRHCEGIRGAYAPVGPVETELAQAVAEDRWRLKRARALENSVFALGQSGEAGNFDTDHPELHAALAQARTWLSEAGNLQLLTLYEQRIHRSLEKSLAELKAVQQERKDAYRQALEEAELLAQFDHMRGQTYDPAPDFQPTPVQTGFAFSPAEIQRAIVRTDRLAQARFYQINRWNPREVFHRPAVLAPRAA